MHLCDERGDPQTSRIGSLLSNSAAPCWPALAAPSLAPRPELPSSQLLHRRRVLASGCGPAVFRSFLCPDSLTYSTLNASGVSKAKGNSVCVSFAKLGHNQPTPLQIFVEEMEVHMLNDAMSR